MKDVLVRFITNTLLLVVVVACAWWAGHEHAKRKYESERADAALAAGRAIDREWERGDKAAQTLRVELTTQRGSYSQLEGVFREYKRTHALLAGPAAGVATGDALPAGVAGVLPAGETPPASSVARSGSGGDPALTVGAVWLWNDALVPGHDPAGSCSIAGATQVTGAAHACGDSPSGITLGEAWDNHLANAQICADNRLAHQRLIDYIQQAQGENGHD